MPSEEANSYSTIFGWKPPTLSYVRQIFKCCHGSSFLLEQESSPGVLLTPESCWVNFYVIVVDGCTITNWLMPSTTSIIWWTTWFHVCVQLTIICGEWLEWCGGLPVCIIHNNDAWNLKESAIIEIFAHFRISSYLAWIKAVTGTLTITCKMKIVHISILTMEHVIHVIYWHRHRPLHQSLSFLAIMFITASIQVVHPQISDL